MVGHLLGVLRAATLLIRNFVGGPKIEFEELLTVDDSQDRLQSGEAFYLLVL